MEKERLMAISLALIAHEMKVDPAQLRILRFRELKSGTLDTYLEKNGIAFRQYRLGERT